MEMIKQLATQAHQETLAAYRERMKTEFAGDVIFSDMYDQRFAELLVRACADLYTHDDVMAPVGQSAYGEAYQDGWIEGSKAYRETILEYFGVES